MKSLNIYIHEAWSGVKQQSLKAEIEAWCEEMGIDNYTINSKGEIDVDRFVDLEGKNFKELPYKFGTIKSGFYISQNRSLMSLKNCPNIVVGSFGCDECPKINSLEGCPKKVDGNFWCGECKRTFTKEEVQSLCNVKGYINN